MLKRKLPFFLACYASYQIFLKPAYNLGGSIYNHWFRPRADLSHLYGLNSYALVTGSTNGIGKAIAHELSKEGFNLVLLGRSEDLLAQTKAEIQKIKPDCKVETRKLDLMNQDLQEYKNLQNSLKELDISVVVNNAGFMSLVPFAEDDPLNHKRTVTTNIGPYVYMTKILLPQLKEREAKSAVVFTSSVVANGASPLMATYCGSKAFNHKFAISLASELKDDNKIDILSYQPGVVATNMSKSKEMQLAGIISPEQAARTMLDKLGQDCVSTGSWKHAAMSTFFQKILSLLPEEKRESMLLQLMKKSKEQIQKTKTQ